MRGLIEQRQLWTLLCLLGQFQIQELIALAAMVQNLRLTYESTARKLRGGFAFEGTNRKTVLDVAERAHKLLASIKFETAARAAWLLSQELNSGKARDYSSVTTHLRSLEMAIFSDAARQKFVHVQPDRADYFPWRRGESSPNRHGFGPDVDIAFPSALEDINEAGYCLAVEANTAAVYHLMCAVEHALRALAADRRVKFPRGPIELQQWGDILRELEKAVLRIQNWPKSLAREAAHEFYNRALQDCRSFNDAYRRHLAHSRRHYDRNEALSVMIHVRDFMRRLSTRISSTRKTPLVWKRA